MKKSSSKPEFEKTNPASKRIGISSRYLRQLTAEGKIPVHKLGPRCHVYKVRDLELFMESHRIGGE
jgi:hypothetical protein